MSILNGDKGAISIDGTLIHPKSLKISLDSLASEDSGRALDGTMYIEWIKSRYWKLEVEMPPCSYAEVAKVSNLCLGKKVNVSFIDPYTNAEKTVYMYNSNSSADVYSGVIMNGLIQSFTFNLIDINGEV